MIGKILKQIPKMDETTENLVALWIKFLTMKINFKKLDQFNPEGEMGVKDFYKQQIHHAELMMKDIEKVYWRL